MPSNVSTKIPKKKDKKPKVMTSSHHDEPHPPKSEMPSSSKRKNNEIKSSPKTKPSKPVKDDLLESQRLTINTERPSKKRKTVLPEPEVESISATRKSEKSTQRIQTGTKFVTKPAPKKVSSLPSDEEGSFEWDGIQEGNKDKEDDESNMYLHGFSTDNDDDSSDEEYIAGTELDISKLPTVAKDDAVVKQKLEKAKRQATEERGVIYLGRIPHGFYEDQLKAYFTQFGTVTRLRLSRNKKTGKSKHYAFLEFDSSSVAKIVAETMDNYLLMGHILQCKVLAKDEIHPELWVGANRKWRKVPHDRVVRAQHDKVRTEEEQKQLVRRLISRQNKRKHKLAEAGIKYDLDAVGYKIHPREDT